MLRLKEYIVAFGRNDVVVYLVNAYTSLDCIHIEKSLQFLTVLETATHNTLVVLNTRIALTVRKRIHSLYIPGTILTGSQVFQIQLSHYGRGRKKRQERKQQTFKTHIYSDFGHKGTKNFSNYLTLTLRGSLRARTFASKTAFHTLIVDTS